MHLSPQTIDNCFKDKTNTDDVLQALYKLVFPDWDNIVSIKGWPTITRQTNEYIFQKFVDFDKEFHPDIFPGGAWFNQGFSTMEAGTMRDWTVDISRCEITYRNKHKTEAA